MDRIQELLAKGIDKLTEEELAELKGLCDEEADRLLDEAEGNPSDEQISALETIAGAIEAADSEEVNREQIKAERAAKVAELSKRIKRDKGGDEPVDEPVDDEVTDEDEAELVPAVASMDDIVNAPVVDLTETGEVVIAAPTAVAASAEIGRPGAMVTRVAARRPESTKPKPKSSELVASMTASANLPGVQMGARLDNDDIMFKAWDKAVQAAMTASLQRGGSDFIKIPVCGMSLEFPEDRILDDNGRQNRRKIDAVASPNAITASGGVCAPIPVKYDMKVVGNEARPVKAALARFGATRGGVTTLVPPTLASIPLPGVANSPISKWTMDNDENPTSPTTKPYMVIPCTNDERTTEVYAIPISVKIGNFRAKWFPEQIAAFMSLVATQAARYQESLYLKTIADGSTTVTHGQVLGTARDVLTSLRQLIATQRYRLRAGPGTTVAVIVPQWLKDMMLVDLVRIGTDGGTAEERLSRAEGTLNSFFAVLNANVYWHQDFQNGVSIGSPGGPLAGAQGAGPVIGWPNKVRAHVYLEGSWLDLDGGSWDFGVIRDSTLVGTNDYLMFSEIAEAAHYDGVPGETFNYDIDICSNGLTVAGGDIDVCTSGS